MATVTPAAGQLVQGQAGCLWGARISGDAGYVGLRRGSAELTVTTVDTPENRKRLTLAATILGSSLAFIDATVVIVANDATVTVAHSRSRDLPGGRHRVAAGERRVLGRAVAIHQVRRRVVSS